MKCKYRAANVRERVQRVGSFREVPSVFCAWTKPPRTTMKSGKRGKTRVKPRLVKGERGTIEVRNMLKYSSALRDQPWTKYYIKESDKGPVIWEIKECPIWIRWEHRGVPMSKPFRLVVAKNVMNEKEEEIKYFVSNASQEEPLDNLLLAAFSRWRVERSFQDTKQKLGLGDYEGRCYAGLIRYLLLCSLAYYFLQCQWLRLSKKTERHIFYQVSRESAAELLPRRSVLHVLRINVYYRERNAVATLCHRRTKRKRLLKRGLNVQKLHQCKWI